MSKWDIYYKKTLDNIHNNIQIFENMIIFYYKLLIINKLTDEKYIYQEYKKYIEDINIFKQLFLDNQNLGIFTIFNNIPDILHPLEEYIYMEYGSLISFINTSYFNKNNDDIIGLKKNIFKYDKYYYPLLYQDIAPYNYYKKYIYVNINYFDFKKYDNKNYCLLFITRNKNVYSYVNGIYKKKEKNNWIINNYILKLEDLIYLTVLRKIEKKDIIQVFNVMYKIKKDTEIYSYHGQKRNTEPHWYSLKKDEYLNDPYKIFYKENDILYRHNVKTLDNLECINLSIDILSNNNIKEISKVNQDNLKIENIDELLDNIYNSKYINNKSINNKSINNKSINNKYINKIYNGNLNKILSKSDNDKIWKDNKGKRLLNEIINKSSNFYNEKLYYFKFLENYGFNTIINSYGYYEDLDKFYSYELGFNDISIKNIKLINVEEIKLKFN
jgi:hypothetical protein